MSATSGPLGDGLDFGADAKEQPAVVPEAAPAEKAVAPAEATEAAPAEKK
jgi:hypothetical protein